MKRISLIARTGLALSVLAVPMALAGCGGGPSESGSGAVTTISSLDWYSSSSDVPDRLNKCAAKAGVTLDREGAPVAGYFEKVLQRMSSKTLPDVLVVDGPNVQQIAATGALVPLSDYNISTDGYTQGVLQNGTYNGKVYGLSPVVSPYALYYNKDLLAKAGVQPPTTWDELKAAAAKLTSGDQYGIAFTANTTPGPVSSEFLPFAWSNGGDETNIDSPQFAEALQLWTDLVQSGSASAGVLNWDTEAVQAQFVAGKAAMMINGSWEVSALDKAGFNYGVVKSPTKLASDTPWTYVGGSAWTVARTGNEAKQAKAAEVVACMYSDENALARAKFSSNLPSKTTLAAQYAAGNPKVAVFADLLKTGRSYSAKLGPDWPKTEAQIIAAIQSALAGKASPADALKQAKNNG